MGDLRSSWGWRVGVNMTTVHRRPFRILSSERGVGVNLLVESVTVKREKSPIKKKIRV